MNDFIKEYRAKYPEYGDIDDDTLVSALNRKYNAETGSNVSLEDFNKEIGYSPLPAQEVAQEQPMPEIGVGDELSLNPMDSIEQPTQELEQPYLPIDIPEQYITNKQSEPSMLELVGNKLKNIALGTVENAISLTGQGINTAEIVGRSAAEKPIDNLIDFYRPIDIFNLLPKKEDPNKKQDEGSNGVKEALKSMVNVKLGYKESVGWEDLKKSFSDNGALSGTAWGDVLEYGLEQGVKSIPDMAAMLISMPAYVWARSGEMGTTRAINSGKKEADLTDVVIAAPFAIGSALVERIGMKGMANAAIENLGKELLKSGVKAAAARIAKSSAKGVAKEAVTEAFQEGVLEYVGEKFGTDAKMSFGDALDRAAGAAVAGGLMGGAISGAGSAVTESVSGVVSKDINNKIHNLINNENKQTKEITDPKTGSIVDVDFGGDAKGDVDIKPVKPDMEIGQVVKVVGDGSGVDKGSANAASPKKTKGKKRRKGEKKGKENKKRKGSKTPKKNTQRMAVDDNSISKISKGIEKEGITNSIRESKDMITLDKMIVPEEKRGQGLGTKAMDELIAYSDKTGKTIALTPSKDFGGKSLAAVTNFYKKLGFIPNRGKKKNWGTTELMIREPAPSRSDTLKSTDGEAEAETDSSLYQSRDFPPRKDTVRVDGRPVAIPDDVVRKEPIVSLLEAIIGKRIYNTKIKGKGVAGDFSPSKGVIRMKKFNDLEVLAHEAAHYLDVVGGKSVPDFGGLYKKPQYEAEMRSTSYPGVTGKVQLSEGFAEFVRLWSTNSEAAKAKTPEFYKAFTELLATDRKLNKDMRKLQVMMHKFYNQGPDKAGRALIGSEISLRQKFADWRYRRFELTRQSGIDMFDAARRVEMSLTKGIAEAMDSAWKLFRMSKGADSITDYVFQYGTIGLEDGDIVRTGKGLNSILKPAEKITVLKKHKGTSKVDLLMYYFAGRRALELHNQGRENLITKQTAREWVNYEKDYPVFKDIAKEFQAFNKRMLSFYVQAGLIDIDTKNAFIEKNKDYVPFNRVIEGMVSGEKGGGSKLGSRLKGGTANVKDIFINIQDNLQSNIQASIQNMAKVKLYSMIMGSRDGAIWANKLSKQSSPVKVYEEEMAAKMRTVLLENGIVTNKDIDFSDPELLTFWQHGLPPTLNDKGNIVDSVIINGKREYFEVSDPLLQDMLIGMNPHSYNSFMRGMFAVKNLLTRSVTMAAEFVGANLVRDTMGSAVISKNNFIPFVDSFVGMYSYFKKDKYFQEFMMSGGGGSGRIESLSKEGSVRKRLDFGNSGIKTLPGKAIDKADYLLSAFEYGTRIGELRNARKKGKSVLQSGFEAIEISTDFRQSGNDKFTVGYMRTVPFLNAMVQSIDRLNREIVNSKAYDGNPTAVAMKGFIGLTLPTLVLYLINRDDQDYLKIPLYKRRTNFHIPVGNGRFITIARPYDVGFTFATIPELMMEYIEKEDGRELVDGLIWTMAQMYGIDGVPAAVSGLLDVATNKKWTGAPVLPRSLEGVDAPEQYNATTSEMFIRMGEMTGLSPIKAEHVFKAQTGYLGGYLMWGVDKALWDEERFGEKPDIDPADNIFIKRFLSKKSPPSSYYMEKFFDLKEVADNIVLTAKAGVSPRRVLSGKYKGKSTFEDDKFIGYSKEEKAVLFGLSKSMGVLTTLIYGKNGLKTKEVAIKYNKELSGKEKRKQIDEVWEKRNDIFMKYYNQAKTAVDKAGLASKKRKKGAK